MNTKISTIVDDKIWKEFKALAEETHQNIGGLLGEALREFIRKRRLRPDVLRHMEDSIAENEEFGRLLAK
jgi:predicted transcriptional regulator